MIARMLAPGAVVALCSLSLLSVGVVMVNSAGLTVGDSGSSGVTFSSILTSRTAMYAAMALVALAVASRLPLERWLDRRVSLSGLLIGTVALIVACLFVYIPGIGTELNGAQRWIGISIPGVGLVTFQPSELAKWGILALLAAYCVSRGGLMSSAKRGLGPALLCVGIVVVVVAVEDLGTAVLIAGSTTLLLVAGGARIRHFVALTPVALGLAVAAVLARPYRLQRLATFLDPYADPAGAGYHMIQSMVAVANGEGFGRGLGFGLQKFGYLPADRSDFLFAVICEELGIAGAALVISLYVTLLWAGWGIARKQASPALQLLGLGIVSTVGLQAIINMFVVTGLGPTKGIALPLLSAGGSGWILTAGSLGLLVGMDRTCVAAKTTTFKDFEEDLDEEEPVLLVTIPAGSPAKNPSLLRETASLFGEG